MPADCLPVFVRLEGYPPVYFPNRRATVITRPLISFGSDDGKYDNLAAICEAPTRLGERKSVRYGYEAKLSGNSQGNPEGENRRSKPEKNRARKKDRLCLAI